MKRKTKINNSKKANKMYGKTVDLQLTIDGLILKENETPEDIIQKISEIVDTTYPIIATYEVIE